MSKQDPMDVNKYLHLLLKLGVSMCLSIFTGFGCGYFIEKKFPKNGLFLLIGIGLGIGTGFMILFREIKQLDQLK